MNSSNQKPLQSEFLSNCRINLLFQRRFGPVQLLDDVLHIFNDLAFVLPKNLQLCQRCEEVVASKVSHDIRRQRKEANRKTHKNYLFHFVKNKITNKNFISRSKIHSYWSPNCYYKVHSTFFPPASLSCIL